MPQDRPTRVFAALDRAEQAPDGEGLTTEFRKAHEAFLRRSVEAMRRFCGLLADGHDTLRGERLHRLRRRSSPARLRRPRPPPPPL